MKKRFLACLLTLCLMIGMVSALGFSASATEATAVATVTSGDDVYTAFTLADAINTAVTKTDSTVKLLADAQTGGLEIGGDYAIDLNGKTLTVTDALNISAGIVTILDSSNGKTGRIVADKTSAIVLKGGSMLLTAGNLHSAGTFAVQNCGTGEIFLSGTPSLTSDAGVPLYVGYANTLNGNNGAKADYTGEQISVSFGCKLAQDTVLAKNATAAQFTVHGLDTSRYAIEEQEGSLILVEMASYAWTIVIALAALALIFVIFVIVHTIQYKKQMKLYSVSFPVLMAVLALVTKTQMIGLIAAGAVCAIALVVCVVCSTKQSKQLTAAKKAKALKDAQAKIAAAEAAAAEEAAEEVVEEAAEEVAEEAAEETAEEVDEEAAEETAEEVVEEAAEEVAEEAAEEAAEEVAEEAAEETAEEVVEEAAEEVVEEAAEEVAEEAAEEIVEEAAEEVVEEATEEVVEEAAEEAAEEVAEEVTEEVTEEVAEEAPAAAAPPKAKPDRVVIAETDANGNVIYSAYKKSFTARVIQSPAEVQERYEALKNALLSYKKVNSRVSWSYDSIKSGRKQLAKFAIRGKSLCLFLALDMSSLEGTKYNVADAGSSKKYADVPCRLRLSSKRSIKWGLELIEKLAEQEGLVPNPKFTPQKWCMENETTESLIEKGLIKKIV